MSTPYTKSSEISQALYDRLTAVLQSNGCETDIGQRVFRGRRNVDESTVPCAVVIEGSDSVVDRPGRLPSVAVTQRYALAAYVKCDPNNPNDAAHAAIRDLKRAVFAKDGTLTGKVLKVSYKGKDIGPRADGLPIVFVTVEIDVEFVEDLTNP